MLHIHVTVEIFCQKKKMNLKPPCVKLPSILRTNDTAFPRKMR